MPSSMPSSASCRPFKFRRTTRMKHPRSFSHVLELSVAKQQDPSSKPLMSFLVNLDLEIWNRCPEATEPNAAPGINSSNRIEWVILFMLSFHPR